ncbi:leucyl/phenylalanyl-tRNA--protein transferase [Sphingobacterium sp. DK4209]|uniref:Leucyl/phenylalanyl-tRNA--protein transferase n=1 Tax=Sphingobacterium zhuxiongii TaxID=2662364 RepID=A0A5Q0QC78_9SPHI|nr:MULTISPECIES: leucyl/phenylalanyl-tRNA--protein transferase [unclassified Sphingobacterium]MVZ64970.1 leucyl/phenylalanyl-tRNA--protein transferase [Sphingobacterium sp. DK4209]QGA25308.1 leucyl/phenylalanyl-tRNA--protein transferase [Sphingobacterium sp. dk4302]
MPYLLDEAQLAFPHPRLADEDGLLAIGADLKEERLLLAYQNGIFPWYDEDTPILWYSPHERFVIPKGAIKISKSMRQLIRSKRFRVSVNEAFPQVIEQCARISRDGQQGTWILPEMKESYISLHHQGYAHSIEVWEENQLVGGLYGVQVGKVFGGESMFSKTSNASKIALISLAQEFDLEMIDCQVHSDHLESMGAKLIPQAEFLAIIQQQKIKAHDFQRTL